MKNQSVMGRLGERVRDGITLSFLKELFRTPLGRAFVLEQSAQAEVDGEAQVFEQLLAYVTEEPELKRMIGRHQADEHRHAELFRACVARQGAKPPPAPAGLAYIPALNRALGGFFGKPVRSRRDVMEAYLVLQVIEERAVTELPMYERALRPLDPQSADTVTQVLTDEVRHLQYCRAVSLRYAESPAQLQRTLRDFRDTEARIIGDLNDASLAFVLDQRLIGGTLRRTGWRWAGSALSVLGGQTQPTPFYTPEDAAQPA